jgi:hypothetical protein
MISTNIKVSLTGLAVATMLLSALPASAQTITASVSASAQASLNAGATLAAVIARGDADITARIDALNALAARVQSMSNVSATEKATLTSELNTNVTGLTGLQGQIDANTDVTSARTEDQSIFTAYRIYALVIPQGWILASADRIDTITGLMTVLSTKLQTRITADESASGSASASLTALSNTVADMNAKIADANTQSAAAQARVSSLVPDQGNQAVITSNHDALVAARADTRVGTQDLVAARADITTVIQGLQAFEASASASGSASGSTN